MPQQRSRTRAVIPGVAILGKQGAAKAALATMGGAVVPGRAVLGNLAEQENARAKAAREGVKAIDPKQAKGPKLTVKKPDTSLPPLVAPRAAAAAAKAPEATGGFSEKEAIELLQADPESWEQVLDIETERPDGLRPAVAAAILALGDRVVENPIPEEALAALKTYAGDIAPAGSTASA